MHIHFLKWIRCKTRFPFCILSPGHLQKLSIKILSNSNFCTFRHAHVHLNARMCSSNFLLIFPLFSVSAQFLERPDVFCDLSTFIMEELAEINFIAAMEGQEAERSMAKIVSDIFTSIRHNCTFEC